MTESINFNTPGINSVYTAADFMSQAPVENQTVQQSQLDTDADVVVDGKHSFQVKADTQPEVQLDRVDTPKKPMPLQGTQEQHETDGQQDTMELGDRPQADYQAFEDLAEELGDNGKLIMSTLAQTHTMQARLTNNVEQLTDKEIGLLKEIATDLNRELEQGLVSPGTLLTRANTKQFKLTSLADMTELLETTNNKVNALTTHSGFKQVFQELDEKLTDSIKQNQQHLFHVLTNFTHIKDKSTITELVKSAVINPTKAGDQPFDPTEFLSLLQEANGSNSYGSREDITHTAAEIFNLAQKRANLRDATQNLIQVRQQVLDIKEGESYSIQTNPKLSDEMNANNAIQVATDNIKRLQRLARHPDKKLMQAHEKAFEDFFKEVNESRIAAHIKRTNYSPEDPKVYLQQFQSSLKHHAQTIRAASQQLQFAVFQPARQELINQQLKTINAIRSQGGTQTISGSVGLGVPGTALGVPLTGIANFSYSYTLDCSNPEGAITAASVKGITVGLTIGKKKVCSLTFSGSKLFTNAKIFATPESFVEHNTNNMMTAILLKRSFLFQKPHNRMYNKHQWIAMTNNNLLLNRLNVLGAVQTGDKLSTGDLKSTKSIYTEMKTRTTMLKSDLKVADGIFTNGSSVSKAKSKMTINSGIFDMLAVDPRLYAKEKDTYYYNRTTSDENGASPLEQLRQQEQRLQAAIQQRNLKQVEKMNQRFYLAMEDLNTEFETYANVVNLYESETPNRPEFARKLRHLFRINTHQSLQDSLLDTKKSYDESRGATNRGEYVRAMMFTHARLNDLYKQTLEGMKALSGEDTVHNFGITPEKLDQQQVNINNFKNALVNPPMRMNHKRHVQKFMTIKKTSQIITKSMDSTSNFVIPSKLQAGLEFKSTAKSVEKHHMRSQQVTTNTVEFSINSGNIQNFAGVMAAIAGHCHDETLPTATIKATLTDFIKHYTEGELLPEALTLHKNAAFRVQLNFITGPDGKNHLNYCNLSVQGGTSLSGNVSVVTGSLATNRTNNIAQFIGHKTLNYPFSRYFFTKQPDGSSPAGWYSFMDSNIKNVRKLFNNAITPGTLAYQELQGYSEDGEVPDCQQKIDAFQNKYLEEKVNDEGETYKEIKHMTDEEVKEAFTDLMKLINGFESQVTIKRLGAQNP